MIGRRWNRFGQSWSRCCRRHRTARRLAPTSCDRVWFSSFVLMFNAIVCCSIHSLLYRFSIHLAFLYICLSIYRLARSCFYRLMASNPPACQVLPPPTHSLISTRSPGLASTDSQSSVHRLAGSNIQKLTSSYIHQLANSCIDSLGRPPPLTSTISCIQQ
jgi:hypothetical protein